MKESRDKDSNRRASKVNILCMHTVFRGLAKSSTYSNVECQKEYS